MADGERPASIPAAAPHQPEASDRASQPRPRQLQARAYRLGAGAALLTVLSVLADLFVSARSGDDADIEPGSVGARGWFELLQRRPLIALRNLGLLNVVNTLLAVPIAVATLIAQREDGRRSAAVAAGLQLLGTAVYIANNRALRMLRLSRLYARATSDDNRDALVAAGDAALARGEDFTPGSFPGLFLSGAAGIATGLAMLRGQAFGRTTALAGIVGPGALLVFTVWTTFVRRAFRASLLFGALGGLVSLAWYVLTARRLFQLASEHARMDQ